MVGGFAQEAANVASPLPYILNREYGPVPDLKKNLFTNRLHSARNLYRRDLVCHFGCVNAIEFSNNGELLVSGGDDRRVMLWKFGQAIMDRGAPEAMKAVHQSNIFCLAMTRDDRRLYSGGNDDIVIVHDMENKCPLEVLQHQRAVCSLSIDPYNDRIITTAGNDGRLLLFDTRRSVHECMVISRSRKAFHGVAFHPVQQGMLASANSRDGLALWDLRSPRHPAVKYVGKNGDSQSGMSVRWNHLGTQLLALRRRLAPVLYEVQTPLPLAEFYHRDYYNSCTMKSCCFAGESDEFVLSGSDDFQLYMWKVPEEGSTSTLVEAPHIVLYGHRSIVNQVRYNSQYNILATSGVEKIIKLWSAMEFPTMAGELFDDPQHAEGLREMYSHEDYVSLVHHSGQYISHNYAEQSTREDPRMMAFFDSLVQRELECLAEETDSLDGSSSGGSVHHGNESESSDSDQIVADFLPLPPKRATANGGRSGRGPNRLARLVASRCNKSLRSQKRGLLRRNKQSRTSLSKSAAGSSGVATKGKRTPLRRARGPRRIAARTHVHTQPLPGNSRHSRVSAPSSERTDSDEPASMFRNTGRNTRPLRRRINLTRTSKRKSKATSYRKPVNMRSTGTQMVEDSSDSNMNNFDHNDDNLAQPSTSTGYRGQNSALFRIAEVDSDDDQSVGSRPISPRNQTNQVPANLVSIIPTPINGSRDTIGDSLRVEPIESESNNSSPPASRVRMNRRVRRNGRLSMHRSDSSESPSPKEPIASTSVADRLSPNVGYNRTVARLMNETNESELESSCSTESSIWPAPDTMHTPDSGVGTVAGSSTRTRPPADDVSDDGGYEVILQRQRIKRTRRSYGNLIDSDSN